MELAVRLYVSIANRVIIESISMSTHIKYNQSLKRMCLMGFATRPDIHRMCAINVYNSSNMVDGKKQRNQMYRNVISVPKTSLSACKSGAKRELNSCHG